MAYMLQVVDWRDDQGTSHPEYVGQDSLTPRVERQQPNYKTRAEAEAAAEAAWIEPDCNGVAPVCIVTEV